MGLPDIPHTEVERMTSTELERFIEDELGIPRPNRQCRAIIADKEGTKCGQRYVLRYRREELIRASREHDFPAIAAKYYRAKQQQLLDTQQQCWTEFFTALEHIGT